MNDYSSSSIFIGSSVFSRSYRTFSNFSSPIFFFKKFEKNIGLLGDTGFSGLNNKFSEKRKCLLFYLASLLIKSCGVLAYFLVGI